MGDQFIILFLIAVFAIILFVIGYPRDGNKK